MIHLQCPNCHSKLAVKEDLAGRLASCPKCQGKVRIPPPETITEDDLAEERISAAPKREPQVQRPRRSVEEDEPEKPARPRRRRTEDEDSPVEVKRARPRRRRREDDDYPADEDEPPRRSRKKRRRRISPPSDAPRIFDALNPIAIGLIAFVAIWVVTFGLSFAFPPLMILPIGLGFLLMGAGNIWFLIIAFQDDMIQGLLCMFVPLYSLFYLISNFDEVKMPFFTQVLGIVMLVSGFCAGGIGGGLSAKLHSGTAPNFRSYYAMRVEQ